MSNETLYSNCIYSKTTYSSPAKDADRRDSGDDNDDDDDHDSVTVVVEEGALLRSWREGPHDVEGVEG